VLAGKSEEQAPPTCGIVMPISEIDGCSESHWSDVLSIVSEAIDVAGFTPNIVSNADDVGIIQKRIIQNLYENEIVVCDVSGKNPNVMFELGMRLAFDKPTIIIKDDKTSYSFDTAPIDHIDYPRDLRYGKIEEFKRLLSSKIKNTYAKSKDNHEYTTFLKHFGSFTVAKLDSREVSKEDYVLEELKSINNRITQLAIRSKRAQGPSPYYGDMNYEPDINYRTCTFVVCLAGDAESAMAAAIEAASSLKGVATWCSKKVGDHEHLIVETASKSKPAIDKVKDTVMGAMRAAGDKDQRS
jgi:hypothetical protein